MHSSGDCPIRQRFLLYGPALYIPAAQVSDFGMQDTRWRRLRRVLLLLPQVLPQTEAAQVLQGGLYFSSKGANLQLLRTWNNSHCAVQVIYSLSVDNGLRQSPT